VQQQAVQQEEERRQGGHGRARRRQGPVVLLRALRAARQGAARAVLHHAPLRHDAGVLARVRLSPLAVPDAMAPGRAAEPHAGHASWTRAASRVGRRRRTRRGSRRRRAGQETLDPPPRS
jgi:hypothetical protein